MRLLVRLLPALTLAAACGGDDGSAEPTIIPGGGIHDPGIDGVLNVYVIDGDTDQVIANATVKVGDVEATTDVTGLVVFDGVTGPQTILAKAGGYAASMWLGADGANVTIPMDKTPSPSPTPAQAQLSGAITGWDALPAPAANHVRAALITYSQDPTLGAEGNDLAQPPAVNMIPASACVRVTVGSPPCAWRLNVRTGTIALGLTMIDIDTRGNGNSSDDVTTVTGYAVKWPLTVVGGANQTGVMMELPPPNSTTTATVDFGTPPAALTQVAAVAGLDLGTSGVLRTSTVDRAQTSAILPSLATATGSFYELIGIASEPVMDGTAAQSIQLRRGIASPSALTVGDWLAPPTGLASDRATASFARGRAEGPYIMEFNAMAGGGQPNRVLSVAVLDDSTMVTLPAAFAPLPAGAVTMTVSTIDTGAPLDLRDFEVDALTDAAIRFAGDTIKLP